MKTQHSFALSIAAHLVVIGAVVAVLSMSTKEVEEEIVLELSMSAPEAKNQPSPIKQQMPSTVMQPTTPTHVTPKASPIVQPMADVIQPSQTLKNEVVAKAQTAPTVQKSEPIADKIQEPIVVPSPPSPPKPSAEEEYLDNHLSAIRDVLIKYRKYPNQALRLKQEGSASISFRLKSNGEVEDITVQSSSGYDILDSDALNLIAKTAHYFPRPPKSIRITVPLRYSLKNAG
jgi:periplasmic protein TonB